jgi:hypothetical protein
LVWAAVEGLNPREREVLELSVRHGLEGQDLAAALGVPLNHCHALLSTARSQLERSVAVVIVARAGRSACPALEELLQPWDGTLTPLWRKRIARHLDRCGRCGDTRRDRVSAQAVLAATPPLVVLPAALRDRVLDTAAALRPPGPAATGTCRAPSDQPRFDHQGFPRHDVRAARSAGLAAPRRLAVAATAAVLGTAMVAVLAGALGTLTADRAGPESAVVASLPGPTSAATTGASRLPPSGDTTAELTTSGPNPVVDPPHSGTSSPVTTVPDPAPAVEVSVPDLIGTARASAERRLADAGLVLGTVTFRDVTSREQDGAVLAQSPTPGSLLARGGAVDVTLGRATTPTTATVPSMLGLTPAQARSRLARAGFTLGSVTRSAGSGSVPLTDVVVVAQSPNAGVVAGTGTPVDVVVGPRSTRTSGPSSIAPPP